MEELVREIFEAIFKWLEGNESWIKPVSFIISPILAGIAFYGSYRTRLRLERQSKRLGILKGQTTALKRDAASLNERVREEQQKVTARGVQIQKLEDDLRRITEGGQQLWKLRPNRPFPEYRDWYLRRKGAPLVTIGHLKGGVGKTTLAANLAAYVSTTLKMPVLLVDLDYQGSLTNGLMLAAERSDVESNTDLLFEEHADLATLERAKIHLTPAIDRGWLVPASYPFAETENRLLMQWLLKEQPEIDVRYRLANVLLRPEIRESYGLIIFDMPPRMTMGAVNAMIASHYFIVPTILDKLSVEAVSLFLSQLKAVKEDLNLELELGGIVATLTREAELKEREQDAWDTVGISMQKWGEREYRVSQNLPIKEDIAGAAGEAVAYNMPGVKSEKIRKSFFDPIFEEILTRIGVIEKDSSAVS